MHEHVGLLTPSTVASFSVRAALAAAARTTGVVTDSMPELEDARRALAAVDVPTVDLESARQRLADAKRAATAVQADVAAARGAVQARDALAADTAPTTPEQNPGSNVESSRERLADAIAEASERETELVAAEQAFARARKRARAARDARSRRLALEDRVGRLERTVRVELVDAISPQFGAALATVGAQDRSGNGQREDDAESLESRLEGVSDETVALAVTRVARIDAPVVLATDRFETPTAARDLLETPVILAAAESKRDVDESF